MLIDGGEGETESEWKLEKGEKREERESGRVGEEREEKKDNHKGRVLTLWTHQTA